tara:strand:- start:220 stop:783 length:564 start_codon:yes stop_codon:yes gene_type:complete
MSGVLTDNLGRASGLVKAAGGGGDTWTYHSEVTVSSGTSQTFESFAANTRRIWISFEGIDTGADCDITVVLGDSGGYESSGYVQHAHGDDSTSIHTGTDGFVVSGSTGIFDANQHMYAVCNLVKMQSSSELWAAYSVAVMEHQTSSGHQRAIMCGMKTLSASLDKVKVEAQNSGSFAGGKICVLGES